MSRTSNYLVCEGREIHYTEWSPAPEKEYCLDFYARLAVSLVDQLGIRELHWLGTSMGGAIGIRLAAGALKGRIRSCAGDPSQFDRMSELEQYFRSIYKPYGRLSDEQWRRPYPCAALLA